MTASPPVRHLWILRHAKAASDPPWGGGDQDRPLTARGRRDASALGKRLAADPVDLALDPDPDGRHLGPGALPRPGLAVCSAAVRTRQTTELIVEALGGALPVSAYRSLYAADPELVLRYVREIDEGASSALLVGHNPTVFHVAWQLLADPDDPDGPSGRPPRPRSPRVPHLRPRRPQTGGGLLGGRRARVRLPGRGVQAAVLSPGSSGPGSGPPRALRRPDVVDDQVRAYAAPRHRPGRHRRTGSRLRCRHPVASARAAP